MGAIAEAAEEEEGGVVEERSLPMAGGGAKARRMSRPSLDSSLRKLDKEPRFVNPFGGKEAEAAAHIAYTLMKGNTSARRNMAARRSASRWLSRVQPARSGGRRVDDGEEGTDG